MVTTGSLQNCTTLKIRFEDDICFIQIDRPDANNTINNDLIEDMSLALTVCANEAKIVVLEGLPEVFCFGADFTSMQMAFDRQPPGSSSSAEHNPERLYDLWSRLTHGPFVTIAHVRGKANAGGIGFVAACDLVISEEKAVFSLSELLFGLMPACVLPFLIRRTGISKANYITLMTQPISAKQAQEWGLVDVCEANSQNALRQHLLRLRRLSAKAIARYKRYIRNIDTSLATSKAYALEANHEVFADTENMQAIARYVNSGRFPWEK